MHNKLVKKLQEINAYAKYAHNDRGLGDLFADIYKDTFRYNITTKTWYFYNGISWLKDIGNVKVTRKAKHLFDALSLYSLTLENDQAINEYSNFIKKLGSLRNRKIMLEDAQDKYAISNEQLDTDIYLFNCQNGTFNLLTFKLQPHNPNDLISKTSNVIYNPSANSMIFHNFIHQILQDDEDKIAYLQKILGYILIGCNELEEFYILYGPSTRNGKSTLLETIVHMLGGTNGYAVTLNPESLASKQFLDGRQASGDIARLKGHRLVHVNEAPQNMTFNANLLKTLTGRDSITVREIYQTNFDFVPSFKIVLNTNYLPNIMDNSLFKSNRVKVIKFNKHFTEQEQDKHLKEKLKTPEVISSIFNWCLQGLKDFYATGATPPKCVLNDIDEYRNTNDKVKLFIEECLIHSKENLSGKNTYMHYKEWLTQNGYPIENRHQFFSYLRENNIMVSQGTVKGKTVKNVLLGYSICSSKHKSSK